MRRRCCSLLLLACSAVSLRADPTLVGTTSANFLKLGAGARAAALGSAVAADPSGLSDHAYNPAGLGFLGASGLELTHTQWFQGAAMEGIAGALNLGSWGGLGLSYSYLGLPTQLQTATVASTADPAANFKVLGSFTPTDMDASLTYAYNFGGKLALGASFKGTQESLLGPATNGYGADLGLLYRAPWKDGSSLSFGLAVLDLGNSVFPDGSQGTWPQSTDAGIAYSSPASDKLHGTLMFDVAQPYDQQATFGLGVELDLGHALTPRLGFRHDGIFNPWSIGLGVRALSSLNVDFAVVPAGDLGTTYRAALGYRWGQRALAAAQAEPVSESAGIRLSLEKAAFSPSKGLGSGRLNIDLDPGIHSQAWGLYIYDGKNVARLIQGSGPPPKSIDWDGKRNDGSLMSPGTFPTVLALKLEDGSSRYSDGRSSFSIYDDFPALSLEWDAQSAVSQSAESRLVPTTLIVRAGSSDKNFSWRVSVVDAEGKLFRVIEGPLSPLSSVLWDGKGDKGEDFYSSYEYGFKLALIDKLGNELRQDNSLKAKMVFDR